MNSDPQILEPPPSDNPGGDAARKPAFDHVPVSAGIQNPVSRIEDPESNLQPSTRNLQLHDPEPTYSPTDSVTHPSGDPPSQPTNPLIQQSIDPAPAPTEATLQPSTCNLQPGDSAPAHPALDTAYRGNGFVARLPKVMRDQLNQMMLDGVSYPQIIKRLGEPASHLKPDHLYQWKKRGHKDWLVQQDWLAERRARRESAADLIQDCDATQVNQSALHLGTLYIFDALRDLRAGSLDDKLGGDSAAFARRLNALCRASRESLLLQKYREACAKARAALQALRDPKRKQ